MQPFWEALVLKARLSLSTAAILVSDTVGMDPSPKITDPVSNGATEANDGWSLVPHRCDFEVAFRRETEHLFDLRSGQYPGLG